MKHLFNSKKTAILLLLLCIIFTNVKAQILSPYLINRELKLTPILKQQLITNRALLKQRNPKFELGATDQYGIPVSNYTGAIKTKYNKSFNAALNKKYTFKNLITTSTKTYSLQTGNTLPNIRSQRCGSCWSYAVMAAAELNYIYKYGKTDEEAKNINLSEQQLLCYANAGTCVGGYTYIAAKWLYDSKAKLHSETALPDISYSPKKGNEEEFCPQIADNGQYKVVDWAMVETLEGKDCPEVESIKKALLEHGAVTASFYADSLVFAQIIGSWVSKEVYTEQEPLSTPKNYKGSIKGHAVVIVGWDDNQGCWIIRNSWGANWGDKGYALFAYGAHGIGTNATWVEIEKVKPKIFIGNLENKVPVNIDPKIVKPITPIKRPPPIKRNK